MPNMIKGVGADHTAQLLHGPGGLFNTPGLENPFLSTVVSPKGIGQYLPAYPTTFTDPRYGLLTEILGGGEDEPDYICDDAPTGSMKSGTLSATFGRLQAATKDIDLGTIALTLNSADRTDLMLLGNLLPQEDAGVGFPNNINEADLLNNAIKAEMVTSSFMLSLKMNRMVWQGNPANATANGGHIPFNGLDRLIKTGYVDSATGNVLPPADSVIVDGAWGEVDGAYDIVGTLRKLMAHLEDMAENTVGGAQFAIAMRAKMWDAITDVWSVKYVNEITTSVSASSASRLILDAGTLTAQRDAMKQGMVLPLGGKLYPVIIDNGIKEQNNADDGVNIPLGSYSSSIYIVPFTIGPGMPVLYWEYLDWSKSIAMASAAGITNALTFWTDGARFIWTIDQNKMCIKLQTRTEPRIVLRTPQLAARIDDLLVTPTFLERTPHSDEDGYVGGGEATRTAPAKY